MIASIIVALVAIIITVYMTHVHVSSEAAAESWEDVKGFA
jgi:hypothetical protein